MSTRNPVYAEVIVASPLPQLDRALSYRVPERLRETIAVGCRVKVPLRNSLSNAYVTALRYSTNFEGKHQEIEEVVSPVPVLTEELLSLARNIASRSVSTVHEVLRLAIPTRQVRVEKKWWLEHQDEFLQPHQNIEHDSVVDHTLKLDEYHHVSESLSDDDQKKLGQPGSKLFWHPTPGTRTIPRWSKEIAEVAVATLNAGQSSIIIVPDFRDIAYVETAFSELKNNVADLNVLRLDSQLSNQQRYLNYLECLRAEPAIILGNRSAILAPAKNIGTILVWEESDPLHIEQKAPYHSVRDAALLRASSTGARLVFAGHSTSYALERLVSINFLDRISSVASRPTIRNTSGEDEDRGFRIPSQIMTAIGTALQNKQSVLLQVAKPTRSAEEFPDDRLATVSQTGSQLGQSFPGVQVVIADGDHVVQEVLKPGVIVVATRGAEPLHPDGYGVIALLDGGRMLARESLDVVEDTMRWWLGAATLARPDGVVYTTGLPHELVQALMIWQPERFIQRDLEPRKTLRMPPYIRLASIRGSRVAVYDTKKRLERLTPIDEIILEPADPIDEAELIVKIRYQDTSQVTEIMRSQILKYAAGSGKKRLRLRIKFLDSGRGL